MAQKYMSYNKVLLTFTVPTDIKEKSIKNGRYTKLRKLIKIRAYIAKLLNNSSDVKYFMNIELGEHYSNPHLHLQLWIKNSDTSSIVTNIYEKTIAKFDLNKNRCYTTEPTHAIPIYNYVIKDYAKDLTDKQIWDLETQKKRFRKIMDSKVRFYSKSKDSYCKSIYRKLWYGLGIARDKANEFLDFFINKFFFFNKRNLPKISSLVIKFSYLCNKRIKLFVFQLLSISLQLNLTFFLMLGRWFIDVLFYSPCLDPPFLFVLFIYASEKFMLKEFIMVLVYFQMVFYVWNLVFEIDMRARSPCVYSLLYVMILKIKKRKIMKLDYSYCLNQDSCIHRRGCKRWIGNYTDEEAIFVADNVFEYIDDKSCMKNCFNLLDRFRLSDGKDFK